MQAVFLSTPSARRATLVAQCILNAAEFLSTPSARRATGDAGVVGSVSRVISIHALREEGDLFNRATNDLQKQISIHALREEGDIFLIPVKNRPENFYPRPPRGGRPSSSDAPSSRVDFYPRPPRGGRREAPSSTRPSSNFYPRPPRGGRQQKQRQNLYFQTNYTTFCTNLEEP